jgi:glucokinase
MTTDHSGAEGLSSTTRLLGDVGGTNIRLAWQAGPGQAIEQVRVYPCANFPDIEAALRHYLSETGQRLPAQIALGMANPVAGDQIKMTNHDWAFSIQALQARLGVLRLQIINDFTALALALPDIEPEQLRQVGGGAAVAAAPVALLGAGTGLGVSGLFPLPGGRGYLPIAGEGGHVTLAAETAEEWQVIECLARRYGHVSAERVLSGQGLVDLYHALRETRQLAASEVTSAADVTAQALTAQDPLALQTLAMFCGFLGSVAGNLALTLGARGGVYLGGGIVPRLGSWFDQSPFRQRFEGKGRFKAFLAPIPCWVIDARVSPALQGAARSLDLPSA